MGAPGYIALLKENAPYRRLWLGEVVSFLGDWLSTIALYTMAQRLSDSALAVSGVLVCKTLPSLLVVPLAGPFIDRMDLRRLMIATDVGRAACVVGLIAANRLESLPLMYGALVVLVGFSGIFIPARTAAVPLLVSREELPVAMALSGGTWSVMLALGAAAGGLITALAGVEGSLVLDGLTFLGSAALLWRLPALPPGTQEQAGGGFLDGLRYVLETPYVLALAGCKCVASLSAGILVMLPLYGERMFELRGPEWVGFLYGMRGLGALLGSIGLRGVVGDASPSLRAAMLPGFVLIAVGAGIGAVAPTVWAVGLGFLVAAAGSSLVWVFSNTLLQEALAPAYRGRVFSLEFGALTLAITLVSLLAGWLVDVASWHPDSVMVASALLVLAVGVPWGVLVVGLGGPLRTGRR